MVSTLNFSEDDMSENELNSAFSQKDMSADCSQTKLVERLKNITERIEKLEKNYSKPNYENFIFNHKNLITDFQQKKTKDWALKVAGHIWTKDEVFKKHH